MNNTARLISPRLCRWNRFAYGIISVLFSAAVFAANTVQLENAKPGTSAWQISNPSTNREIEGYASLTSVNRGGSISFFVSTNATAYTMEVYRIGWYGGTGARQVLGPITLTGILQPMPSADSNGLRECNWANPYTIVIPNNATDSTDWASGVYLVKLTAATSGLQSYIIFTVRDDGRASDYLYQSSVNTWQAYNIWGGQSLYSFNSVGNVPARKVSFSRPYDRNYGTGDFLGNITGGWEINMVRFLEREGFDVSYATNVDLHEKGLSLISNHKAFLSVGHDEYWSYQMKSTAQQARDQGKHLGFFGADAVYWQVRYEPSTVASAAANRTLVGYKEAAQTSDPYWLDTDPTNNKYVTARFRDLAAPPYNIQDAVAQPENGLIGVMYHGDPFNGDIVVSDATSWIYAGTNLSNGSHFIGMLGYETDSVFTNGFAPPGLQKVAESNDTWGYSHMTIYSAPSGSVVFASGSMQWIWGLDDYNVPNVRTSRLDPMAQQTTRNILARFVSPSSVAPSPPANLVLSNVGKNIKLSWTQSTSAGVVSNKIYRAAKSGGPYTLTATISATTSFIDNNVNKSTTYYYVVSAVNSSGFESVFSIEASATSR